MAESWLSSVIDTILWKLCGVIGNVKTVKSNFMYDIVSLLGNVFDTTESLVNSCISNGLIFLRYL